MKLVRYAAVCTLLLLAAVPSFALGCQSCDGDVYPYCISTPDSGTRCLIGVDYCFTRSAPSCTGFTDGAEPEPVMSEWTVASIEVSRPNDATKSVTTHAAVAVAELTQPAQK